MYSPFGSISGGIHLVAKHPIVAAGAVALVVTLQLSFMFSDPPAAPAPPSPSVPAIAYKSISVA